MKITDIQNGDSVTFATVDGVPREFDGQCPEEYEGAVCECCGLGNSWSEGDIVRCLYISLNPTTMFLCGDCLKARNKHDHHRSQHRNRHEPLDNHAVD